MDIKIPEFGRTIVGPAIRSVAPNSFVGTPVTRGFNLGKLGIQPSQLTDLFSEIHKQLNSYGWTIGPLALGDIDLNSTLNDVATLVANHAVLLAGPKTCPNGHVQYFPGQEVCAVDKLRFR